MGIEIRTGRAQGNQQGHPNKAMPGQKVMTQRSVDQNFVQTKLDESWDGGPCVKNWGDS